MNTTHAKAKQQKANNITKQRSSFEKNKEQR